MKSKSNRLGLNRDDMMTSAAVLFRLATALRKNNLPKITPDELDYMARTIRKKADSK
jgi:hypothetical protein